MRASRFVAWITGFAAALVLTPVDRAATQASNFPNHPIKIIIGPSPDIFSRIVAEHLQQTWGQPVVVEPRPGAGGKLAVTAVSTAAPDGHTLLFATPTYTLNTAMKVASYDLLKEFAPAANIGLISYALVTHASVPAKSVAELVAYAKQHPGKLNCASAGIGTVPHLACEYLNKVAGTNILHVPYRDVNSAMMATVGNTTQMFFGVSTSAKSQIEFGRLERACRKHRATLAAAPGVSDDDGVRLSDVQHAGLGWISCDRGHAEGRCRETQCRGAARCAAAGIAETVDRGRHGTAAASESSGVSEIRRERHRTLDAIRRGRRCRKTEGGCSGAMNVCVRHICQKP